MRDFTKIVTALMLVAIMAVAGTKYRTERDKQAYLQLNGCVLKNEVEVRSAPSLWIEFHTSGKRKEYTCSNLYGTGPVRLILVE
jgi:hypothetical protein